MLNKIKRHAVLLAISFCAFGCESAFEKCMKTELPRAEQEVRSFASPILSEIRDWRLLGGEVVTLLQESLEEIEANSEYLTNYRNSIPRPMIPVGEYGLEKCRLAEGRYFALLASDGALAAQTEAAWEDYQDCAVPNRPTWKQKIAEYDEEAAKGAPYPGVAKKVLALGASLKDMDKNMLNKWSIENDCWGGGKDSAGNCKDGLDNYFYHIYPEAMGLSTTELKKWFEQNEDFFSFYTKAIGDASRQMIRKLEKSLDPLPIATLACNRNGIYE